MDKNAQRSFCFVLQEPAKFRGTCQAAWNSKTLDRRSCRSDAGAPLLPWLMPASWKLCTALAPSGSSCATTRASPQARCCLLAQHVLGGCSKHWSALGGRHCLCPSSNVLIKLLAGVHMQCTSPAARLPMMQSYGRARQRRATRHSKNPWVPSWGERPLAWGAR